MNNWHDMNRLATRPETDKHSNRNASLKKISGQLSAPIQPRAWNNQNVNNNRHSQSPGILPQRIVTNASKKEVAAISEIAPVPDLCFSDEHSLETQYLKRVDSSNVDVLNTEQKMQGHDDEQISSLPFLDCTALTKNIWRFNIDELAMHVSNPKSQSPSRNRQAVQPEIEGSSKPELHDPAIKSFETRGLVHVRRSSPVSQPSQQRSSWPRGHRTGNRNNQGSDNHSTFQFNVHAAEFVAPKSLKREDFMESRSVISDEEKELIAMAGDYERPCTLKPVQMMQAYLLGVLCLSCDSVTHPMTRCPNGAFVCPNCHNAGHRGSQCTEPCRFCHCGHSGVGIMSCIKAYRPKLRLAAACMPPFLPGTEPEKKIECARLDNPFGRTVWISKIPPGCSNEQLIEAMDRAIEGLGEVEKLSIRTHEDWCYVTLSTLPAANAVVKTRLEIKGQALKVQFRKSLTRDVEWGIGAE